MTNLPDLVNGAFELLGGILYWKNVGQLMKDKMIKGVDWRIQGFFTIWGVWNVFFYSNLNQWASFYGGIVLALGNGTWTTLAYYYSKKNKEELLCS
jgi:hypothetical protein